MNSKEKFMDRLNAAQFTTNENVISLFIMVVTLFFHIVFTMIFHVRAF